MEYEIPVDPHSVRWQQLTDAGEIHPVRERAAPSERHETFVYIIRGIDTRGGVAVPYTRRVISTRRPDHAQAQPNTQENNTMPEHIINLHASDSDVDRRHLEDLEGASNFLSRFVEIPGYRPIEGLPYGDVVSEFLRGRGRDPQVAQDRKIALRKVRELIKERCVHPDTRIERVPLALGLDEWSSDAWKRTDLDHIVFASLWGNDATLSRAAGRPIEAFAAYFSADLAGVTRRVSKAGNAYESLDRYNPTAYTHILRVYETIEDAESDALELGRAIQKISTPASHSAEVEDSLAELTPDASWTDDGSF